jgi:hypothetical protein
MISREEFPPRKEKWALFPKIAQHKRKHNTDAWREKMKHYRTTRLFLVLGLMTAWLAGSGLCLAQQGYQMQVSFPGYTNRTEVLTNFPVLVVLSNGIGGSRFNFATYPFATSTGCDMRFRDSEGADLDYEIESWDTNSSCYVWVQVPELKNDGTAFIWANWGDPAASGQLPCTTNGAVWANGFSLVEHMAVNNGTAVADATPNRRQATIYGAYSYVDSGMIGRSLGLGTPSTRTSGLQANTQIPIGSSWTISSWFKDLQPQGDWRTLVRGPTANHQVIVNSTSAQLGSYLGSFIQAGTATLAPVTPSQWRHFTAVGSGGKTTMYVDGLPIGTGNFQSTEDVKAIGYYQGAQKFADYLDEFRIESCARSSNWVWACRMNQDPGSAFTGYANVGSAGGRPTIYNLAPTGITAESASFNGILAMNGDSPAAVSLYWGTADGGRDPDNWANTNILVGGPWPDESTLATNIASLAPDQDYFYSFGAVNESGADIAFPSVYFIDGALTLAASDASLGTSLSDTATVVVSRPATCTNGPLTVYYSLGGTATNEINYAASPASGELVISAGQTEAVITLAPVLPFNYGAPKSVSVTLEPGNYVLGAANSAECMIETVFSQSYTWASSSGDWSLAGNWTPAGGPPSNGGDSGLIASGTAMANANLGGELNYPALTVGTGGTLAVGAGTLDNPLTFDGGILGGTANGTLAGDIALGPGGMVVGTGSQYTLGGQISGSGGITSGASTLRIGGGSTDTVSNTFTGPTIITNGVVSLCKANNVRAVNGDVLVRKASLYSTPSTSYYYSGQMKANGTRLSAGWRPSSS